MIKDILNKITQNGGVPYFCGGFVRDKILGSSSNDIDIEVYKLEAEKLYSILSQEGECSTVGKSFGVIKLKYVGQEYDFSLPRTDYQVGTKHNDIIVQTDPNLDIKVASSRRDFTINSLMMDVDGNIIDSHGGIADLKNKVLRATSDAFSQDPLRGLRAVRFAARFNLKADERTLYLSRLMLDKMVCIPPDRIRNEWLKIAQTSYPKAGLDFLDQSGLIQLYPMLDVLQYVPQHEAWHPEGFSIVSQKGVWDHTKYVVQEMAAICDRENIVGARRTLLFFSAVLHDVGKAKTTELNKKGNWAAPQHDHKGVPISETFMERCVDLPSMSEKVGKLVKEHMAHINFNTRIPSEKSIRKLASRLAPATIEDLCLLIEADVSGRPPLPKHVPQGVKGILEIAKRLNISLYPEEAKVRGIDLINLGYERGPKMGEILRYAYKIQMSGFSKEKILKQVKGYYAI